MCGQQYWYYKSTDRLILSDRKRWPRFSLRSICLHAKSWLRIYNYLLSEHRSRSHHSRLSVLNIYRARNKWSLPHWQLPNHRQSRSHSIYRLYLDSVDYTRKFIRLYSIPQPLPDHGLCGHSQSNWDKVWARHTTVVRWIVCLWRGALLWLSWDCNTDELACLRDTQRAKLWLHCASERWFESHRRVYSEHQEWDLGARRSHTVNFHDACGQLWLSGDYRSLYCQLIHSDNLRHGYHLRHWIGNTCKCEPIRFRAIAELRISWDNHFDKSTSFCDIECSRGWLHCATEHWSCSDWRVYG